MSEEQKNTADLAPPKTTFEKIKDDTKEMVNKLLSFFRSDETQDNITVKSPTTKILQGIHKVLVEQEAMRKADFKKDKRKSDFEGRENERRHRQILKTLLGIPQPSAPEVEIKKKEEAKAEETKVKVKSKPTKGKKPTARRAKAKKPTVKKAPKKPVEKKPSAAPAQPPAAAAPSAAKVITGAAVAGVGLLPLLAKAESPDYNQLVIPTKKGAPSTAPLTGMTIKEVLAYQDSMIKSGSYPSSAVGKYQIIKNTLEGGVKALKLNLSDKFDEKTQDRLYFEYLTGSKRKNLNAYLTGKSDNLEMAQMDMAMEFASFGVPRDVKAGEFGKGSPARDIRRGQSFYAGDGANKASVTPEQSATSLAQERDVRMGKKVTPAPVAPTTGSTVDSKSSENKQLKSKMADSAPTNKVVNNVSTTQETQSQPAPKKIDDRNPMERKLQHG